MPHIGTWVWELNESDNQGMCNDLKNTKYLYVSNLDPVKMVGIKAKCMLASFFVKSN